MPYTSLPLTAIGVGEENRGKQKGHTDAECILMIADALPGTARRSLEKRRSPEARARRKC